MSDRPFPSRVLIVQPGFLGDAVLATGLVRALRSALPECHLGMLVRGEYAPLFEDHPALAAVHRFAKREPGGAARVAQEVQQLGYDLALVPHRSLRSAWIARSAGVPRQIGFAQADVPWLFTDRVRWSLGLHEVERNARLLDPVGIEYSHDTVGSWLVPAGTGQGGDPGVILAPGSVWGTKRWTVEGFASVARALRQRGVSLRLVGSGEERPTALAVAKRADLPEDVVLAGRQSLVELRETIAAARVVLCNDSAPLHIAEAVGTPVVAIFGPTIPDFGFAPRSPESIVFGIDELACRPCNIHGPQRCPLGTHICMEGIDADAVAEAVLARVGLPVNAVESTDE